MRMIAFALGTALLVSTIPAVADAVAKADTTPQAQADEADKAAWEHTLRLVRESFPDVPRISTRQLAAMRADGATPGIVLLDARSAAEFNVSHLDGALLASNTRMALEVLEASEPGRTVVVYCSVGYRSSRLAALLRAHGFEKVFNLEGSLFRWANEGRPLHRGTERVHEAHPYDEEWGHLLDRRLWAD